MTNAEIKQVLLDNDVRHLYHANTVRTSTSFLESGGLLSRGYCEDMGLAQTSQYTDDLDRQYGIYYDIFFDSIEIQIRTGLNYYGPVLFEYNIDVLDSIEEGRILITKQNPDKWYTTESDNERYFRNINELSLLFEKGNFGQHITITDQRSPLSFQYLENIILSDPQQDDNSIFDTAKSTLSSLIQKNGFDVPLTIREYAYNNKFYDFYSVQRNLHKHFCV